MTNSMLVPTWTPGELIPDGIYDRPSTSETGTPRLSMTFFWAIGMPIISALFLALLLWAMIRYLPKDKEKSSGQTAGDPSERTVELVEK